MNLMQVAGLAARTMWRLRLLLKEAE